MFIHPGQIQTIQCSRILSADNYKGNLENPKKMSVIKVQLGNDQEKVQSGKDSHSKDRDGKTKLTIRYHENIS